MELNLLAYRKQQLDIAWINNDTREKIKLNLKQVLQTDIQYYMMYPFLSVGNGNKLIGGMENRNCV
jgi:hypothetical protein